MVMIPMTSSLYSHDNRVQVPQILTCLIPVKSGDLMLGGGATSALSKALPWRKFGDQNQSSAPFMRHVNEYIKV